MSQAIYEQCLAGLRKIYQQQAQILAALEAVAPAQTTGGFSDPPRRNWVYVGQVGESGWYKREGDKNVGLPNAFTGRVTKLEQAEVSTSQGLKLKLHCHLKADEETCIVRCGWEAWFTRQLLLGLYQLKGQVTDELTIVVSPADGNEKVCFCEIYHASERVKIANLNDFDKQPDWLEIMNRINKYLEASHAPTTQK